MSRSDPVHAARVRHRLCGLLALAGVGSAAAEEAPFAIQTISIGERVVQADLVDLDGDGRGDLLSIAVDGLPPDELRGIHVFYGRKDGVFPARPDWSAPLPEGVGAYDLAELDENPGSELVLLRSDRLTLLSLARRRPAFRDLPIDTPPTLAAVGDERGVDRLRIARRGLAEEVRLLVPGFGWTAVLTPSGATLGRVEVGARANYFVPKRPGPVASESELEVYFDQPRLLTGDVDGDGRGDLVSANRHELRVFLQRPDGRFGAKPTRRIALGRLRAQDHVRGSGGVRVDGADFDGDGRLDLLISTQHGSLFDARTTISLHRNRGGDWSLDEADQEFRIDGGATGHVVLDVDGDGRLELLTARIPTGVLEVAELLVTRAIDAEVKIYRRGEGANFEAEPWQSRKLDIGWSFESFTTRGFVPTLEPDLNGDGVRDLLGSGDGERLEVSLGDAEDGHSEMHASQEVVTDGRIRFGDLDADGLADFVLYDPRRPGQPIRIGTNRGVLPNSVRPTTLAEPGESVE